MKQSKSKNPLILIVDNCEMTCAYLSQVLQPKNYDLLFAKNGVEGLNKIKESKPDLIITDILMPHMDGYEMVRKLMTPDKLMTDDRLSTPNQKIPIIFYVASCRNKNDKTLVELFKTPYVIDKPASPESIVHTIEHALHKPLHVSFTQEELEKIDEMHIQLLNTELFANMQKFEKLNTALKVRILKRTHELKNQNKYLQKIVFQDDLTGIFNRRYLDDTLKIGFQHTFKLPLAVAMLDVDNFKQVNDKFGHPTGDVVLAAIGQKLKKLLRKEDVACRYGGDEFLVILYKINLEEAIARFEEIRQKIAEFKIPTKDHQSHSITISLGFVYSTEITDALDSLIEAADKALYEAKNSSKNKIVMYQNTSRVNNCVNKLF